MTQKIGAELAGELFLSTLVFKKLFSQYFDNYIHCNTNSDIIIKSCLSGSVWNKDNKPYIYWSGENRIPKKSEYETKSIYILTTKTNIHNALYIPFCLYSNHIYKNRLYTNNNKKYIIGYCASNKIDIRELMFDKLVEKFGISNCISFGTCYGKYKQTNNICGGDYQNPGLIKHYSDCKFVIAMENSIGDGYITEKIVNVFYSGSIPIYWGSPNINEFFNEKTFINVSDFENIDQCINYIGNLTDDNINYMLNQPIYTNNNLINIFNDEYNKNNNNPVLKEYNEKINYFMG